jgi:hypothetical protein
MLFAFNVSIFYEKSLFKNGQDLSAAVQGFQCNWDYLMQC